MYRNLVQISSAVVVLLIILVMFGVLPLLALGALPSVVAALILLVIGRSMQDGFHQKQGETKTQGNGVGSISVPFGYTQGRIGHRTFASAASGHMVGLAGQMMRMIAYGAGGQQRLMLAHA